MSAQPTVVRTHLIQLRCEADGDTLWQRYQDRILKGERHPGHIDGSADATLRTMLFAGPPGWIAVESERIVIDTLRQTTDDYRETSSRLQTRFLRA